MDFSGFQPILTGVLFVATTIATAVVGVLFGTNKTLRDTANDRGVRITDLEAQVIRTKADLAERNSEVSILKSMVTGKVELIALGDQLDEHHRQAVVHWTRLDSHVQELPGKLADVLRKDR